MKLSELQAELDDCLLMDGIYNTIRAHACRNQPHSDFLATTVYPNKSYHRLNSQQADVLLEQGYTVDFIKGSGSWLDSYRVSGWKINQVD